MRRFARWTMAVLLVGATALPNVVGAQGGNTIQRDVEQLSSETFGGRGPGSKGLEKSMAYLEQRFREAGLQPLGKNGYRQAFATANGLTLVNLVGVLGKREGNRHVVVGAHYDHLGKGEKGDANYGRVHPGADDNASGVAAMLACARALDDAGDLPRPVIFVAFAGEESGLLGSAHYVSQPALPLTECTGMINLDTVGRLEDGALTVFGAGTARELTHVVRGVNYGFGFKLELPEKDPGASDQMNFVRRGVPSIQVFTGPHADYHRPGDTAEKIDYPGLAKIAEFTTELVRYLAEREEPMAFMPPGADEAASSSPPQAGSSRRVSFGSIPDFNHTGEGVLLSGVIPGSPAEKAGLKEGDLVVEFAGVAIGDLRSFSDVLKSLSPGETTAVVYVRDGERHTTTVTVVERK